VGFLNAAQSDGVLGIPCLEVSVPVYRLKRLSRVEKSLLPAVQACVLSEQYRRDRDWCLSVTSGKRGILRDPASVKKYWRSALYASVDGKDLAECSKVPASTQWLSSRARFIPGRDWIQHVHTWIGALPSRVRTTRGRQTDLRETVCRAGCSVQEITYHVVQHCHRTHGGRVKRHDAIRNTLTDVLKKRGYQVWKERIHTLPDRKLKPDLVISRGNTDVHKVSWTRS
jgi:hypothetical protein